MSKETIYREDAIKAVRSTVAQYVPFLNGINMTLPLVEIALRLVPSADRPQGWIPCSERMPTKAGHYLCSFKKPKRIDNIYVELAYWTGGRWYGYLAPEIKAWMPLPEPWKGVGDE